MSKQPTGAPKKQVGSAEAWPYYRMRKQVRAVRVERGMIRQLANMTCIDLNSSDVGRWVIYDPDHYGRYVTLSDDMFRELYSVSPNDPGEQP